MSITIQMPTGLSLIQTQRLGLDSFYLIDIRSPQSYQANHIPDSYNLQTQSQILQFLDEKGTAKPLLLVCFSSHKAQKMAKEIAKNTKATVHYLDCGIMELAESFHRETTSLMSSLDVSSDTSSSNFASTSLALISIKLIDEKAIKNRLSFVKKISGFNNYKKQMK